MHLYKMYKMQSRGSGPLCPFKLFIIWYLRSCKVVWPGYKFLYNPWPSHSQVEVPCSIVLAVDSTAWKFILCQQILFLFVNFDRLIISHLRKMLGWKLKNCCASLLGWLCHCALPTGILSSLTLVSEESWSEITLVPDILAPRIFISFLNDSYPAMKQS